MRILVFAFLICWMGDTVGMEKQDGLTYEDSFRVPHDKWHLQDLDFIRASNAPLTTATAVGSCGECMKYAIWQHMRPQCFRLLKKWWSKKIDEDVLQAAWHAATHEEKCGQLNLLLYRFPEVTQIVKIGRPILFHAVNCMNDGAVARLLDYGADPNQVSNGEVVYAKHTPLMLAVDMFISGNLNVKKDIVRQLLDSGAQVNAQREKTCDTALLLARETEIASLLVDRGAYVDDKDKLGNTVFDGVAFRNPRHCSKDLIKKILVRGALRRATYPCEDCNARGCHCDLACRTTHALHLQRIIKKLTDAGVPRDVQLKIFSYIPSEFLCSVGALTAFGDMIRREHCAVAARYIPESVFVTVAQRLPAERKSIFVHRATEALMRRRLHLLAVLAKKQLKHRDELIGHFVKHLIPEYQVPKYQGSDRYAWPPPQLVADVRKRYAEMFGVCQE